VRKLAVLMAFLFPVSSLASICPVTVPDRAVFPGIGDGCTTDVPGYPDASYVFPHVGIFKSTFTGSCNNHDKCYSLLGTDYGSCDSGFWSDMQSACRSKYNPLLRPAEFAACMHTADLYYAGVSAWRSSHPEQARALQLDALNRSRLMQASIDGDVCGTTPERASIYATSLINRVRSTFQSYVGRAPTIYEFTRTVNWGDNVRNYVLDRAGWDANLYTSATGAGQVPPIGWWISTLGDYGHTFSVTPVVSGSYFWRIPDQSSNTSISLSYWPPMFNRTVRYSGFVRVQVGNVKNMALVEQNIVLPGTCAPNNGPWVNCQ
jgi:hypothetical protein